jgi:hypothetical protein
MMSVYDARHGELNKTMLGLLNNVLSIDTNNFWALREVCRPSRDQAGSQAEMYPCPLC